VGEGGNFKSQGQLHCLAEEGGLQQHQTDEHKLTEFRSVAVINISKNKFFIKKCRYSVSINSST
jgi:hypothetical protein